MVQRERDDKLTLYTVRTSYYCHRAQIALLEKALEHDIFPMEREGQRFFWEPWYMKLSMRGKVPCLTHGNVSIPGSIEIMEYLDAAFPNTKCLHPGPNDDGYRVRYLRDQIESFNIQILHAACLYHPHLLCDDMVFPINRIQRNTAFMRDVAPKLLRDYADNFPDLKDVYMSKLEEVQ
ncbi:ganglioside-induced differentiation-associated protein 1-like [Glandiceps talaboti]